MAFCSAERQLKSLGLSWQGIQADSNTSAAKPTYRFPVATLCNDVMHHYFKFTFILLSCFYPSISWQACRLFSTV